MVGSFFKCLCQMHEYEKHSSKHAMVLPLHCCSCIQCIQQKHQIRFEGRDSKVCCRLWSCWINDALLSADTALAFDTESHKSRFTRIRNWNTASNTSFENFIFYSILISPWAEGASITSLYDHKYEYVFIF